MLPPQSRIQHPQSNIRWSRRGVTTWGVLLLISLLPLSAVAEPARKPLLQVPPVQNGAWTHSELNDWLPGTFTNTYVEGSVLRLQGGQGSGEYQSAPLQAPFGFNAGVVRWNATVGGDQTLTLDVRSSVDGQTWSDWQRVQPVAQINGAQVSQVFVFPLFTSFLQYRAGFTAQSGSPAIEQIEVSYLSSTAGPSLADIVGRVPLSGPATLTSAPEAVARSEWAGAQPSGAIERQQPQRIEVTQVLAPVDDPNPLATLRALRWVGQNILGQPDLPFHYLIDGQANLYEARGSATQRLPGVAEGTVRIAVVANAEAEGVSEAAQFRLLDVLGWLVDSYNLSPEQVQGADDAPQRLKDAVVELRPAINRAVVESRTLFAEGGTEAVTERLTLYNPTSADASATLGAFTQAGEERRTVSVPAGQRVDVTLNSTFPQTATLGLDVLANQQLFAERTMIVGRELLGSTGAATPARTWYFAEGATVSDTQTLLLVVNPQRQEVAATLMFYPDGVAPVTQQTTFPPRSRTTLRLNDLLPNAGFGVKLVASQPVMAERTVTLPGGATHLATGVSELSRNWSFAEGSTAEGVTTTLNLLNPWPQQVAVSIQIMSEDGTSLSRRYAMPAQARLVLTLNDVVPALPFAMEIEAERPVAAERIMRFDNGSVATATAGASSLATRWTFVEGSTATPAEQFLLLSNPNRTSARLEIAYVLPGGTIERREHTLPALSRLTISANNDVPDQPTVTTIITSNRPIAAERSIFVNGPDGRGAETSIGFAGR